MKTEAVTSGNNPKIKELLALGYKSRTRREKGLFPVEGLREVGRCLGAGFRARTLFRCPDILGDRDFAPIAASALKGNPDCTCVEVTPQVYDKIAYRGGTEGLIAEVEWKDRTLDDISFKDPGAPLVVVLENVQKPGNLGAVLRSADAAGADAVLLCDSACDIYNPNVVRASIGAIFTVPTVQLTNEEALFWLRGNGLKVYTAQLQDSVPYYDSDMASGTAIVMGAEDTGLSQFWRRAADRHILIPMLGVEDSLNVSVSTAILLYEAVRQRLVKDR
ncbi:MAG: RNA methyltransferase [Bacteroidales bacterium]|nr:RNA methyltransferase [Bacteroidales bacterium]